MAINIYKIDREGIKHPFKAYHFTEKREIQVVWILCVYSQCHDDPSETVFKAVVSENDAEHIFESRLKDELIYVSGGDLYHGKNLNLFSIKESISYIKDYRRIVDTLKKWEREEGKNLTTSNHLLNGLKRLSEELSHKHRRAVERLQEINFDFDAHF